MRGLALWAAASVLFVACQENEVMERNPRPINDLTFSTSWEETSAQGDTRTYINEKNQLRWNADDRISVFAATTENRSYRFNGETGDNSGTFSSVGNAAGTGSSLKKNYAVYPYREENAIAQDGSMTVVLPATQHYVENSFGLEANTMTAVTRDAYDIFLPFKNVGGYLKICLYGEDVTVKSITLRGNNGEKLAGKATIKLDAKGMPSVTMSDEATSAITLDCGDGVSIGTTAETATAFWIVLPPTKFEKGFSITVTDTDGGIALQTKDTEFEVTRNIIKPMEPMFLIIRASDDSLKSRLIEFYKSTGGDHWINNRNWCSDEPLSEWYGVTLDSIDQQLSAIKLDLPNNNLVGKADLSDLTSKKDIRIDLNFTGNALKSLDVSGNKGYISIDCSENQLTKLNVSDCPKLGMLDCYDNQLTKLNVSNRTELTRLGCSNNQLTALDVSNCTKLTEFGCSDNPLTTLDVSNCTKLAWLDCYDNQLTMLDASNCTGLTGLNCINNQLTKLNVSNCTELTGLWCSNNQLTSLDIANCSKLTYLYCDSNKLTALNVLNCTELIDFRCYDNQLTTLDVSNCTKLGVLDCYDNQLTMLNASNCTELFWLDCHDNQMTTLNVSNCLKLSQLECWRNKLTTLNVSNCTKLTDLKCYANQLTSLNVLNCTGLTYLQCYVNQLTTLNVSNCTELFWLYCYENQLTALDVSNCTELTELNCDGNQLTTLNVSNCAKLTHLLCSHNQLTNLNIWPIINSLSFLSCSYNKILCQIPAEYAHIWNHNGMWDYDVRYGYSYWIHDDGVYEVTEVGDHGVGWWYPGEPEKGYHRPD